MRIVLFNKGYKNYVKGDVAGLNEEEAEYFEKFGIVTFIGEHQVAELEKLPLKLPQQEKIENLCAICGEVSDTPEEKVEHKKNVHGIV